MTDSTFEKELILEKSPDGKTLNGHVLLKTQESIGIDKIDLIVYIESRGKKANQKDSVLKLDLKAPDLLTAFTLHKVPFSIDLSQFKVNSLKGTNMNIFYTLEANILLHEEDLDKIERSFFTKAKSFLTSDYSIKLSKHFEVNPLSDQYEILEGNFSFKIDRNFLIPVIIGAFCIIFFALFSSFTGGFNIKYWFLLSALIFGITFFINNYIKKQLGKVTMYLNKNNNSFLCRIEKTKTFPLKNQILFYEINEKVIDTRGTTNSTYYSLLHKSEIKTINNSNKYEKIEFNYPKKTGLASMNYKDGSIIWQMKIEGTYFLKIKMKLTCEFEVN